MWAEYDTQMLSSIETELLTLIDAYQFELDECPDLSDGDRRNLIGGINLKYKQIDWLHEMKEKIENKKSVMKFKKKPVTIEAIQWTGENIAEIIEFVKGDVRIDAELNDGQTSRRELHINTLEGVMHASKGDWIIKGVQGEFYPCKPDIFEKTYDPAE